MHDNQSSLVHNSNNSNSVDLVFDPNVEKMDGNCTPSVLFNSIHTNIQKTLEYLAVENRTVVSKMAHLTTAVKNYDTFKTLMAHQQKITQYQSKLQEIFDIEVQLRKASDHLTSFENMFYEANSAFVQLAQ